MKSNKQAGVTLLELLLAMAVVAGIILYLSVHWKNQTQERQLQQTSVEIQNLLQAVSSYYLFQQDQYYAKLSSQIYQPKSVINTGTADTAQRNFWPSSYDQLYNANSQARFISTNWEFCSKWQYTSGSGAAECPRDPGLAGYKLNVLDDYFGVSIVMPDAQLAAKLIAKLPNSMQESPASSTVWAYIPRPTGHYNPPLMTQKCHKDGVNYKNPNCSSDDEIIGARGWIASAGVLAAFPGDPTFQSNPNSATKARTIVLPECPAGYEGHYIVSLMQVQTGNCINYYDYLKDYISLFGISPKDFLPDFSMFWHFQLYPQGLSNSATNVSSYIGGYLAYTPELLAQFGNAWMNILAGGCWSYPLNLSGYIQPGTSKGDPGYMVHYFMTMCVPNKYWIVNLDAGNELLCNQNGLISGNNAGYITQCQDNWSTYNPGTATAQCPVATDGC